MKKFIAKTLKAIGWTAAIAFAAVFLVQATEGQRGERRVAAVEAEAPKVTPPGAIYAAEKMVRAQMRAPRTTKFQGSFYRQTASGHHMVCGMVNSENGFGGMSGFQPYVSINGVLISIGDGVAFLENCGS